GWRSKLYAHDFVRSVIRRPDGRRIGTVVDLHVANLGDARRQRIFGEPLRLRIELREHINRDRRHLVSTQCGTPVEPSAAGTPRSGSTTAVHNSRCSQPSYTTRSWRG